MTPALIWPRWRLSRIDPVLVSRVLTHDPPLSPPTVRCALDLERVLLAARTRDHYTAGRRLHR